MKYKFLNNKNGLIVSCLGFGCMGMSEFYGEPCNANDLITAKTIERAIELGINFFDTADEYGCGHNEKILGTVLKKFPNSIIATKGGVVHNKNNPQKTINNNPSYLKAACEASLKRLGVDCIDLYYLHKFDPTVPIEESVGAMSQLVKEGKIRYLGLSRVSVETLRKACRVHPISAVQMEYSLWHRDQEQTAILEFCKTSNIGFVAYSPLGRSFLAGLLRPNNLSENGLLPRLQENGNLDQNIKFLSLIKEAANHESCTPAQLALAWILAKEDLIVPIPGMKTIKHLEENIKAVTKINLPPTVVDYLDKISLQYRSK